MMSLTTVVLYKVAQYTWRAQTFYEIPEKGTQNLQAECIFTINHSLILPAPRSYLRPNTVGNDYMYLGSQLLCPKILFKS